MIRDRAARIRRLLDADLDDAEASVAFRRLLAEAGDRGCGTGSGGFQSGNKCGKGDGGKSTGKPAAGKSKPGKPDKPKPAAAKKPKGPAPGSQMPTATRDKLRAAGMVGTFPPADVPL